jgi:hypothetical protein
MSNYQIISHACARELILSHRLRGSGRFFRVAFNRITDSRDGNRRVGNMEAVMARFNVTRYLKTPLTRPMTGWPSNTKPPGAAYDRHEHDCFCAYVVARINRPHCGGNVGYRSIKWSSIRWLKINGVTYKVGAPPPPQH